MFGYWNAKEVKGRKQNKRREWKRTMSKMVNFDHLNDDFGGSYENP